MRTALLTMALTLSMAISAASRVKVIDLSWSNPTIDFLEKHLADMEQSKVLDGLTIRVTSQPVTVDGKDIRFGSSNAWNKRPWTYELFQDSIQRLKRLPFKQFTDNFFYLTTSNADFDWFNDDDWQHVAHNFGVAAKVAKEAGLKGFLLDIEEYGKHFWNFEDITIDASSAEINAVAFRRGVQFGREVFSAYPDIVLFMPFALTMGSAALSRPFMNGVLSVMPQQALIYEGHEGSSYRAKSPSAFTDMQNDLRKLIRRVVDLNYTVKARAQILLAPGFYLDAHFTHQPSSLWQKALQPELDDQGRVRFIARNFAAAIDEADPYIWLYGEQACWWKDSPHPRVRGLWEDMEHASGLTDALLNVKYPERLLERSQSGNLVKDSRFKGDEKAWSFWQIQDDQKQPAPGTSIIGNGKAVARHVTNGCFHQTLPIKSGQYYFFLCRGGTGPDLEGTPAASLCFKDKQEQWMAPTYHISLNIPKSGKLETVYAIVRVPADAVTVSVQCNIRGQRQDGDIFFTEVFLGEL